MQRKGFQIRIWQWGLLAAIFVFWWAMTKPGFIPAFFFSDDSQAAFFFGEPVIHSSAYLGVVCGRRNLQPPRRYAL